MNSKGEYNGSRIPRIVVEVGEKVEIEEWPGQEHRKNEGKIRGSAKERGYWKINNMKKRKWAPECGTAEPSEQEGGRAELSQHEKNGMNMTGNKRRKMCTKEEMVPPECGMAQPPKEIEQSMAMDPLLYEAAQNYEMCQGLVKELFKLPTWAGVEQEGNQILSEKVSGNKTHARLCHTLVLQMANRAVARSALLGRARLGKCQTLVKIAANSAVARVEARAARLERAKLKMCQALVNKMVRETVSNAKVNTSSLITKYFPRKRKMYEEETESSIEVNNVDCSKKIKLCHGVGVSEYESELSVEKSNRGECNQNIKNVVFNNLNTGPTSTSTVERNKEMLKKVKKKSLKTKLSKSTKNTVGPKRKRNNKITKYFHSKIAGSGTPSTFKLNPSLLGLDVTWGGVEQILISGGSKPRTGLGFGGGGRPRQ